MLMSPARVFDDYCGTGPRPLAAVAVGALVIVITPAAALTGGAAVR